VNEETQDGDGSYVSTDAKNREESFNLEDSSQSGTITNVRLVVWGRYYTGSEGTYIGIITNGATHQSEKLTFSSSYEEYSYEWQQNPETSAPWTWAEIDALEAYVQSVAVDKWADNEQRVTQVYVEVTYSSTSGPVQPS